MCTVAPGARAEESEPPHTTSLFSDEARPNIGLGLFAYGPLSSSQAITIGCCGAGSPDSSPKFRFDGFLSLGLENGPLRVAGELGIGPDSWRGGGSVDWMFTSDGFGLVLGGAFSVANGTKDSDPYHQLLPAVEVGLAFRRSGHTRFLLEVRGGPSLKSSVGPILGLLVEAVAF
ncbi:MAG: hypothetical protein JST92_24905 [Deltaproteobacteria bacterium]|nr:hypothetical protein [Deltaproteobacteria bacterium]